MSKLSAVLHSLGYVISRPFAWVHNDDDLRGTYPDHYKPTGPEAATNGMAFVSMITMG